MGSSLTSPCGPTSRGTPTIDYIRAKCARGAEFGQFTSVITVKDHSKLAGKVRSATSD